VKTEIPSAMSIMSIFPENIIVAARVTLQAPSADLFGLGN
jgi:hypothetical protein